MSQLLEKKTERFGSVRIIREKGGAVYYCLSDLGKMLGFHSPKSLITNRYELYFRSFRINNKGKIRPMYFLNEYAAEDFVDRLDKKGVYEWLFGNGLSIEDEYWRGEIPQIGESCCIYAR